MSFIYIKGTKLSFFFFLQVIDDRYRENSFDEFVDGNLITDDNWLSALRDVVGGASCISLDSGTRGHKWQRTTSACPAAVRARSIDGWLGTSACMLARSLSGQCNPVCATEMAGGTDLLLLLLLSGCTRNLMKPLAAAAAGREGSSSTLTGDTQPTDHL